MLKIFIFIFIIMPLCNAFSIGDLYVAFGNSGNLRKVSPDGTITTTSITNTGGLSNGIAFYNDFLYFAQSGSGQILKYQSDQSAGTVFASGLNNPTDIVFDAFGNLYVSERSNNRVLKIDQQGTASVFASGFVGAACLSFNLSGDLFVSEHDGNRVSKISSDGTVSLFAAIARPSGIAVDAQGFVYLNEHFTGKIYKFSPDGSSSTLLATVSSNPEGMAFDAAGYLYVALNDGRLVRINSAGSVSTFANFPGNDLDQIAFYTTTVVPECQSFVLLGIFILAFWMIYRK
jgi:serine/threonine-protein kinase